MVIIENMKKYTKLLFVLIFSICFLAYGRYMTLKPYDLMDTSAKWTNMTGSYIKKAESGDFGVSPEKIERLRMYIKECSFKRILRSRHVYGEPEDAHIFVVLSNDDNLMEIYVFGSNLIRITDNGKVSQWVVKTTDFESNILDILLE